MPPMTTPSSVMERMESSKAGTSFVTNTWTRLHKEVFADLLGILLIGPAFVASLIDLLSRTPKRTLRFRPNAVHPVPYLRVFINLELLRRLGFDTHAAAYRKLWSRLYPREFSASLPRQLMKTFTQANRPSRSDAHSMAELTYIPAIVWAFLWAVVAVVLIGGAIWITWIVPLRQNKANG